MYKSFKDSSRTPSQMEPNSITDKIDKELKNEQKRVDVLDEPKNVMISYSHANMAEMKRLKSGLEEHGVTVWADITGLKAGMDFLSKIGQAILDATCFISLLSEKTVESKYCQDELALAYISKKPIFPVALEQPRNLFNKMDVGMKLQLARFEWRLFLEEEDYESNLFSLASKIKSVLQTEVADFNAPSQHMEPVQNQPSLRRHPSRTSIRPIKVDKEPKEYENKVSNESFWEKNFKGRNYIKWDPEFEEAFLKDVDKALNNMIESKDQKWLLNILKRELEVADNGGRVVKENYDHFCTINEEECPFWTCVQEQAIESYTIREVFNMESTVRVEAIENLGKFRSKAVMEALLDLLYDSDNNVRTVAAISLAKTGSNEEKVIKALIKCLSDKDRLVRESGCLSLGRLKAKQAISSLVLLWRNDFISSVRDAAAYALKEIGGEDAEEAMRITNILAQEIRTLTEE
ncbi:DgyrCDS13574 [Dimorphilus gyrociliatus]|uniref:DgyrCDS13574 n=1 Tax=Dimorphilus gyrociliatus TaxID=2664684 RepID=A0A7I8WB13_9ANNE|nr:DgyrCDS13574 [Dimorphilus gyrociliatus]